MKFQFYPINYCKYLVVKGIDYGMYQYILTNIVVHTYTNIFTEHLYVYIFIFIYTD